MKNQCPFFICVYTLSKWKLYSWGTSRRTHLHVNDPPRALGGEYRIRSFASQSSCYGIVETCTCLNDMCCQCSCEWCNHSVCCEVNQEALDGNSSNTHDDVRHNVKIVLLWETRTKGTQRQRQFTGDTCKYHKKTGVYESEYKWITFLRGRCTSWNTHIDT